MNNIEQLISEFRIWELDWQLYDRGYKSSKPKSIDYFIEELSDKYQVIIVE